MHHPSALCLYSWIINKANVCAEILCKSFEWKNTWKLISFHWVRFFFTSINSYFNGWISKFVDLRKNWRKMRNFAEQKYWKSLGKNIWALIIDSYRSLIIILFQTIFEKKKTNYGHDVKLEIYFDVAILNRTCAFRIWCAQINLWKII